MVDKLAKALLGLHHIQFISSTDNTKISKKEKMLFCVLAADVVVSLKPIKTQNLSELFENIISFCDDPDSDVRMVAEESLNRIITSFSEGHILKIQSELHRILKKNGAARCLRVALSRFGQLSHFIRPNKGTIHAQILIPNLIEIAKREEEAVHETLASSLENIFKVLGVFTQNNSLKSLLKAFLHNLSSVNPVIRRCSASCIITLVQHCKKPYVFTSFVLNSLLDYLVPIKEDTSLDLVVGVLGCLRLLLPFLSQAKYDEGISESYGLRRKKDDSLQSIDRLVQVYELCLHYSKNKDHNIVAAALETLYQILQNPPQQLELLFLSPAGFSRSNIHSSKENKLRNKSGSEISLASSIPLLDDELFDDFPIVPESPLDQMDFQSLTKLNTKEVYKCFEEEINIMLSDEKSFKEVVLDPGKKTNNEKVKERDSDSESIISELSAPTKFLLRVETKEKEAEDFIEYSRNGSQDNLYFPQETESINVQENFDIGTFTDTSIPLIYCSRHLASSFLLDGSPNCLKSDRAVRVSIKSLALSCLSAIINIYPVIMKMNLFKIISDSPAQEISDILLYSEHSDPQIRGSVSILIGCFIQSVLMKSKGFNCDWLDEENSKLSCKNLIDILIKGLKDKSSTCIRLALGAVKSFINTAFQSVYNKEFVPLLNELPLMIENSYWLIKVKLVQVLSDLPYIAIYDVIKSRAYQEEVIDFVLMPLLGDEDSRVRFAAAEAIVRIISVLFNGKSSVLEFTKPFKNDLNNWLKTKYEITSLNKPCIPFLYALANPEEIGYDPQIESSLANIVAKLTFALLVPENKHFLFGYIEALKMLSIYYPTTIYLKGWNCSKIKNEKGFLISDLIMTVNSLVMTSSDILDLVAFSNATFLMGNLFAGHCVSYLKYNYNTSFNSNDKEKNKLWNGFDSEELSQIANEILTYLLKLLNLYDALIEEVPLSNVAESAVTSNAFLPLLLHIKKQEKKLEENEEKKSKNFYSYKQNHQYVNLQKLLKNAHTNYKVSLDTSVGDKFLSLLKSTLYSLSIILEIGTAQETGPCAEEMLSYFNSFVTLLPNPTVTCVIQLLKSLFGTNLASNWEEQLWSTNYKGSNLFDSVFQLPIELFSEKIRRRTNFNELDLSGIYRRVERNFAVKNTDKNWLASNIKLFEPMVVKSLQLYTVTGNVELQANVLNLLNQLVQLRVNYCLLDAKQVFVGFVLKQFELIEHGLICGVEKLLPHIFKFLVLLSYEKHHSKSITSIPNILQLCDGLMASDQSVQTHCIPALIPVIEDVFLSKSLISSLEEKELEAQREVLLSMLLKLIEFPEIMDILTMILIKSTTIEEKERWKRWSRQVVDTVLTLANQDRLRIETFEGQNSFTRLMSSLSPNVLRPIDPFLKVLFMEPNDYNCCISLGRWISQVTVFLEMVLIVKEDALLNRLEEISPNINLTSLSSSGNSNSPDPFNVKSFFQVYEPSETIARFIMKVIFVMANKISESFSTSLILQQKLSMFFVVIYHILKSGTFHRITKSLQDLLIKEENCLKKLCSTFDKMLHICPILKCQFSYFLALLSFCDQTYWIKVLQKPKTLAATTVQWCGVISISDYLCDNLSDTETLKFLLHNNIQEVLILSDEIPIKELILTIQGRKLDWALFLEAIDSKEFEKFEPHFVEKLLRLLEMSETVHSGSILVLLIKKYLSSSRLALSLLAGSIACRQVEFLLTLPKEKVLEQISRETFTHLLKFFNNQIYFKRHFNLWGLLNKLKSQVFDISSIDSNRFQILQEDTLKDIYLCEDWYFDQVKERCQKSSSGPEIVCLLSFLNYEKSLEIMSAPYFNVKLLKECLLYPITLRQKHEMKECDNAEYKVLIFDNPLYKAAKFCLIKIVKEMKEIRTSLQKDLNIPVYDTAIVEAMVIKNFTEKIWDIAPCVTVLLNIIFYFENSVVEDEYMDDINEFGILCIQVAGWFIRKKKKIEQRNLENILKCCSIVLRNQINSKKFTPILILEKAKTYVENIYDIINYLIPVHHVYKIPKNEESINEEYKRLSFLYHFITFKSVNNFLPKHLINLIRDLIVNLYKIPELSSQILKVPESCEMQEIESLENFIKRFSIIKWGNRQQFEEIWVSLLTVLGFNSQEKVSLGDNGFIVQVRVTVVEGITTLLKNTLLDSDGKTLIHHGRDSLSMKNIYEKLPLVSSAYSKNHFNDRTYHFLDNLEIFKRDDRYINGLLSVEYLWTAVKQISSEVYLYKKHSKELNTIGLDLTSCIYLLTELYNQWIEQIPVNIKIVTSSLRSSLVISDLFTDISQFQWLLNFCFRVDEIIVSEDIVILPLIIVGAAKAGAIVLPNKEMCDKIKELMLRSSNPPCRIAAIEGLLYLLQSYVVSYTCNHTTLPPVGSTFIVDEANFVANVVDTFLPVALEFIQQFKLSQIPMIEEYDRYHWSLIFYLLQHYQSLLGDLKEEFFNYILTNLRNKNFSTSLMGMLIRGVERLLVTTVIEENFRDQISKISLELISNSSVRISNYGLQLLMILSFLDKRVREVRESVVAQEDPEKVMKEMEKINVLFEKLKRSYPKQAEVVGDVISYILMDFTASDVLSKVIQEFLSSHQPHQKILAGLLFKVFERAELNLIEDWVVFSLPSFIQGLPISMSIWTLNCFFVSASNNPWLRSLFPLVQSLMRETEAEEKKLLCLSGANFFKQLKHNSQKKLFIQTFKKAAETDSIFFDLLSSLC